MSESDSSFEVCLEREKACNEVDYIKVRKGTKYTWTPAQQRIYINFLKENVNSTKTRLQRRRLKVFKRISDLLKKRSTAQVKSHHQKLVKKFGDIPTIIEKVQEYLMKVQGKKSEDCVKQQICDQKIFQNNQILKDDYLFDLGNMDESHFILFNAKLGHQNYDLDLQLPFDSQNGKTMSLYQMIDF